MTEHPLSTQRPRHARTVQAILVAGLLAGVLDIVAAFIVYGLRGAPPPRILQSIASGLLGAGAFKGGAATAALGAALHFLIALSAAAVYYAASRWLPTLVRRPVASGLLYGVAVYVFMNHVVVPRSAVAKRPFDPQLAVVILAVHIVCVGLPIALATARYAPPSRAHP
jgi:uncharacterized membrane protein YagU involved in acid resistance